MSDRAPLALVTGGVRRLGAVIAGKLATEKYSLAVSSHNMPEPEDALAKIFDNAGTEWHGFTADLSNLGESEKLISDVTRHFGRAPDLLVNNAAIFGQDDWQEMSGESLEAHFRINFFAPMLLSQALVKAAGEEARPAIVHIVDQRITNPHGDQLSYCFSKQALAASVRSLASALQGRARVNAVAPGLVIETDDYSPELNDRLDNMMPLGSLPDAQSVAQAVAYLAQAKDITGQIIFADGGAHLKSFSRDFMHL